MEPKYLLAIVFVFRDIDYIMFSTASTQNLVVPTNITSISITLVVMIPPSSFVVHGEKSKKFNKRWQQKMLFYLTTLNLAKFLTEEALKSSEINLTLLLWLL